ncbi:MAG: transporter substrate-binding domain-containing protein [Betaproteobacteria bacterium]|nr:transporter substrate-binding domain-containing protein [Betaproteobacteria bacterium]
MRIVVFADVPPFDSSSAGRELEGFDVDLAKMVAAALGVKVELAAGHRRKPHPYLLTDKVDIVRHAVMSA